MAQVKLCENPSSNTVPIVHAKLAMITAFRPNLSDARTQTIAVRHCETEKAADVRPAYETSQSQ